MLILLGAHATITLGAQSYHVVAEGGRVQFGNLRFHILGPVQVWAGDRWLRLGGPGQRSLLAALLLRANQVVPGDQLLDAIWGEAPPRTAFAKLHAHVSALRKMLGGRFGRSGAQELLVTRPPGYVISVESRQLDLLAFEVLAAEGLRRIEHEPAEAAARLRAALSLWRGRPLDGVDLGGAFAHEAARLEERRTAVIEARIEADLRLGRHGELIGELEALAFANPLRERLHEQLMLALYRSGRRAEALDAYGRARRLLADELGLDPGPGLRRLQRAILIDDGALQAPAQPIGDLQWRELAVALSTYLALHHPGEWRQVQNLAAQAARRARGGRRRGPAL